MEPQLNWRSKCILALLLVLAGCGDAGVGNIEGGGVEDGSVDNDIDSAVDGGVADCGNAIVDNGEACDDGEITVSPPALMFGEVPLGSTPTLQVTIVRD